jgi:cobalt-zinc-cadmium efflux system membrane fusion protein
MKYRILNTLTVKNAVSRYKTNRWTGFVPSFFTALFSLLLLFSCSSGGEQAAVDAQDSTTGDIVLSKQQFDGANMKLATFKDTTFHHFIKANGFVDVPAKNRMVLGSYYGGKVSEIQVITGQRVNKGEILYVIDNPEFLDMQQAYLETASLLRNLSSLYERQKTLVGENVASQKDFLQSEADYKMAAAKLSALGQKLKLMQINPETLTAESLSAQLQVRAPMAASVSRILVTRGQWITAETEAMELINGDILWARLNVYERDLPLLKTGQAVQLRLVESASESYEGVVESIGRTIDKEKRSSEVIIPIKRGNTGVLIPGMYLTGSIAVSDYDVRCLPEDAVVEVDGVYYGLMLINEGSDVYNFEKVELFPGQTMYGLTELKRTGQLPKNARFLAKGAFQLVQEEG